jgi:hypothetical protein
MMAPPCEHYLLGGCTPHHMQGDTTNGNKPASEGIHGQPAEKPNKYSESKFWFCMQFHRRVMPMTLKWNSLSGSSLQQSLQGIGMKLESVMYVPSLLCWSWLWSWRGVAAGASSSGFNWYPRLVITCIKEGLADFEPLIACHFASYFIKPFRKTSPIPDFAYTGQSMFLQLSLNS